MIQINDKKYILTYLIGFILLAVFLFSCNTHAHPKAQIILSILTAMDGIICISYSIKNKDNLHKTAFFNNYYIWITNSICFTTSCST